MTLGRGIWAISSLLILLLTYGLRQLFLGMVKRGFFLRRALLLCDHPDLRCEMGKSARARVKDEYDFEEYLAKILALVCSDLGWSGLDLRSWAEDRIAAGAAALRGRGGLKNRRARRPGYAPRQVASARRGR